jgi:hypothetical protein
MRYHKAMRMRTGAVLGFAVGYYLGARAGRERYEELRRILDTLPLGPVVAKGQALAELAIERFRRSDDVRNVVPFPPAANDA